MNLENLSIKQLVEIYNLVANASIAKFKDKPTGVARVAKALAETNQEVFEVDGELDVRPIPQSAKIDAGRISPLLGKKITLLVPSNPKRPGSRTRARYELYRTCKTSDDYMTACLKQGLGSRREIFSDLSYDSKKKFIQLG